MSLPGPRASIACDTLEDARRVGMAWAVRTRPCELIVHDAYGRVLQYEALAPPGETVGA